MTAIIREDVLHVAWVGDARCIIFRRINNNIVAFPLTSCHHPEGPEKNRIINAGGFVEFVAGKWRVNGRLAVSRTFGDANLKPVCIADPEYVKFPFAGNEVMMLLSCLVVV